MNAIMFTLCYALVQFITIVTLLASHNVEGSSATTLANVKTAYGNISKLSLLQDDSGLISDDDAEEEEPVIEEKNEFDRGTPGIDYLGVGYDAIFGNTLGEEDSLLDPGYRAPIINFEWRKNTQGYSPSLKALYPLNGWVRPIYSCGRSSKVEEIRNLDELRNAFSASAQLKGEVPSASFSASAKYKKEATNIIENREKVYLHTDTCIRYQAGIPLNIPWEMTDPFQEALELLEKLDENIKNDCSAHDIMDTETKEGCGGLKKWINFFQIFGTHYVHQLTLGGKLVQTMKFSAAALEALKSSGLNVDLAVSTAMGAVKAGVNGEGKGDASKLDEVGYRTLTVIGGEMPALPITDKEFATWGDTVSANPMPIGIAAESLTRLMKNELHSSYSIALYKYAEMNGITYETLMKVGGKAGGFMREIKNGNPVVTVNWDVNGAECKDGQKILIGFSLLFNPQGTLLGILPCKRGAYKCNVPTNKNAIRSISWAVCTTGLQPNIIQVAEITKNKHDEITVSCPPASVIQFGIKLLANDDMLVGFNSCKRGEKTCQAGNKDNKVAGIWIVCAPDIYLVENINAVASIKADGGEVKCNEKETIIAGFKLLFMENQDAPASGRRSMKIEICEKFIGKCEVRCKDKCLTSFVMALCADTSNSSL